MTEAEMQEFHNIYRARILICRARGTDAAESTEVLDRYAEANDMPLHVAALVILDRGPTLYGSLELRAA
jgi:hypothetical protein